MNHKTRPSVTQWSLIALFGIVSLLLVTGGYLFYRREERAIRSEKYHELHAIAELKVGQIIEWRNQRIGDARRNSSGYFLRAAFNQWLDSPDDAALQGGILANMESIRTSYGYANVILTGVDGRILLSLDPRLTELDAYAQQLAAQAVASGDVVFGDFFRCPICEQVHLDVIAPILDADGHPAAVLILRSDPEQYLYPLIQSWPTPSRSAETLLVRQDGADVLFLNTLRHRPDPALTLRIPLSQADVPAVRAALGQIGKAEGQDYRGAPVLADVRPVPGSSWFIVAKVDMDEILAEVHYRGRAILLFVSLSVLLAGAMAAFVFSYRQRQLYQNLFRAERERREAQEEIRATLYGIGDGVIAADAAGRVTRMNPVAEQLTGWREAEALGKPLEQVFRIVNEDSRVEVENPVGRVLREGLVVGLANHTLLIARDGAERPIADSGAPIRDEQGEVAGVVLVFRDQTEERAVRRALRESEERYRLIAEHVNDIVWQLDKEMRFVYVSPAVENILGYSVDETQGLPVVSLLDSEGIALMQQIVQTRLTGSQEGSVAPTEYKMRHKDGRLVDVEVVSSPIFDRDGRQVGFAGVTRDITARKQAEDETRQRLVELEALHRASQQLLTARLDPQETYAAVHQAVAQVMPCEAFVIVLEDKPTDEYHAVYLFDKGGHCPPQRIPRGQSLSGRVIASGETLWVDDFSATGDLAAVHFGDPEHVRSILATPLRSGEQVVGMLSTQSYRPHAYEERQRLLLETLAAQFAAAIQNAFLYQQWQARLRELEVMASVSAALRTATTRAEVPPLILDRLLLLLGVEGAALEILDPVSGDLLIELGRGIWAVATGQIVPPGAGLSAQALAAGQPYLNNAAYQDPRLFRPDLFGACRAAAAAPLAVQGQIIGLLWIGSRRPLTDLDLRLLTAVADIAANAIHRTALQEQIAAQARQTAQIMNSVPEGVLLLDASGRVLLANPVAERHLAALAEVSIGERLTHLGERPLAELLTSPPKGLWHEVRAGAQVFEVIARPVADGSRPEHWVLVLHDATQERQVRGQLQQQERLAAVGQLAAGIAHDFNNIMGIILLQARLAARSENLSDQDQERLATISQQVHHAARLIQQILDFSRQAALERQPLDLLPLLKEQIKLLERTLPEHIEIRFVYGRGEYTVNADPTRMQQMVMNLAVNARDAMPEGGVLRIALERVTVEPGASPLAPELAAGEWIRLTVADSGAGIPPQALSHIFEPFYTTKAPGKGSGLGLAQVHGIVGQHEGRIEVQTQMGAGTTFTVYLPALPAPAVAWSAPELGEIPQGQGEMVLVVEDDVLLRAALRETLELWNYQVQEAAHGAEALALLAESGTRIDVVVSDVVMPTMGGVALVHALREQGWDLPVILLSGHPQEKEFAELRARGVRAWLSKPPALDQLARAVAGAVQTQPPE